MIIIYRSPERGYTLLVGSVSSDADTFDLVPVTRRNELYSEYTRLHALPELFYVGWNFQLLAITSRSEHM